MKPNLGLLFLAAALPQAVAAQSSTSQTATARSTTTQSATAGAPSAALLDAGKALFLEKCAFCHGPDTAGGESGPDLTRSTLVADDAGGNRIAPVIRDGRPQAGMPSFALSDQEISA